MHVMRKFYYLSPKNHGILLVRRNLWKPWLNTNIFNCGSKVLATTTKFLCKRVLNSLNSIGFHRAHSPACIITIMLCFLSREWIHDLSTFEPTTTELWKSRVLLFGSIEFTNIKNLLPQNPNNFQRSIEKAWKQRKKFKFDSFQIYYFYGLLTT